LLLSCAYEALEFVGEKMSIKSSTLKTKAIGLTGDMWWWNSALLSRILNPLSILQVATLVTLAAVTFVTILLLHHQTEDYFTPLPSYLASIKVAVPPAVIFFATYAFAFVTGAALTDAPKAALSFARNRFFQSVMMMTCTLIL
jgi:hypothetical protein